MNTLLLFVLKKINKRRREAPYISKVLSSHNHDLLWPQWKDVFMVAVSCEENHIVDVDKTLVSLQGSVSSISAGPWMVPHLLCRSKRMDSKAHALGFHIVLTADLTQSSNVTCLTQSQVARTGWGRKHPNLPSPILSVPTVHIPLRVCQSGWPALILCG